MRIDVQGVSLPRLGSALAAVLLAIGSCLVLATPARAHGGDPGMIHACIAKDGAVKLVSPSVPCPRFMTPLHWRKAGRNGPAGPVGPIGLQGPQGPAWRAGRDWPIRPERRDGREGGSR